MGGFLKQAQISKKKNSLNQLGGNLGLATNCQRNDGDINKIKIENKKTILEREKENGGWIGKWRMNSLGWIGNRGLMENWTFERK